MSIGDISNKKIVHLITRLDSIGGAQIHVLDLTKYWYKIGVNVSIWGGNALDARFSELPFPVIKIPFITRNIHPIKDLLATIEIYKLLKKERPDVLMTHTSKVGVLGRIAAKLVGIPCIHTVHGWNFADGVPQPKRACWWFFEYCMGFLKNRLITVSEYDRQLGIRLGVSLPERTTTVHNGVDDIGNEFKALPESNTNKLIMVARCCVQKDHLTLFKALQKLTLPYELLVVGDGPLLEQTKRWAVECGISGKTKFLGSRRDVPQLLAQSQLMVLTTHWEGLPRSMLEAMRAGLPIIATNVGGNIELLQWNNGTLVPENDVNALKAALESALSNPIQRKTMGDNGRKAFEAHFLSEILFMQTLNTVLDEISISKGKSAP